jgi:translocation and assembly module TamB
MRGLYKRKKRQKTPETEPRRFVWSRKNFFYSIFSGSVLLGGITGVNWGLAYTQAHLVPDIAKLLHETLDRPVQLGSVERVSLTGVRLGASAIPATASDRDTVTIPALEVQFNPFDLLRNQRLNLTITLIRPRIFLDQDAAGNWVNVDLDLDGEELIEVKRIRLRDATVELAAPDKPLRSLVRNPEARGLPVSPNQVSFQQVNLDCTLSETPAESESELELTVRLSGRAETGGRFRLHGQVQPLVHRATVKLNTTNLNVTALNPLLPATARFDRGRLNSRLTLTQAPDTPIALDGTATLTDLAVQVEGEPNLFTQTSGRFRFRGQEIQVSHGQTAYGQIPFEAIEGSIDLATGLNLRGRAASVALPAFLSTFDLPTPVATTGTLQSLDLTATGPIEGAIFAGTVQDVQPVRVDRVDIASVLGQFTYNTGTDRLHIHSAEVSPAVGGVLAAQGLVILGEADEGEPDDVQLDVTVKNVPTDAIARLYGLNPSDLRLGQLQAEGKITMLSDVPDMQVQWHLTQATYPAQGKVTWVDDRLRLQDARIQVGQGWVNATGDVTGDRWQVAAQATEVPLPALNPLLPDWVDRPGTMQSAIQLAGTIDRPVESATGQLTTQIHSAPGEVTADATLMQGRWQAQITSRDLVLDRLSLPGAVTGRLELSGPLADLTPAAIQARGQIQLSEGISHRIAWLNQPLTAAVQWHGDRLRIHQAQMAGLTVAGSIAAHLPDWNWQPSAIGELDLSVRLHDQLDKMVLGALPVPLTGIADMRGQITGTLVAPHFDGNLHLGNFAVNQLAFEPALSGAVALSPDRGLKLNLLGEQDQIALTLDDRYALDSLTIKRDQATVKAVTRSVADRESYRLLSTVQQFPLELLLPQTVLPALPGLGVSGLVSGRFDLVLATNAMTVREGMGEVTIDRLAVGSQPVPAAHQRDRFTGKLRYGDRSLALTEGRLQLGSGEYRLAGRVTPGTEPDWSGELTSDSGDLHDLVTLLPPETWQQVLHHVVPQTETAMLPLQQWFTAAPGETAMVAAPQFLPSVVPVDLSQLQGGFATQVDWRHAHATGTAVNFALQGQNWSWGPYGIQQITIANGQFDGQQFSLDPVQLRGLLYSPDGQPPQRFEASVDFSGEMGDRYNGELAIANIPARLLGQVFNLPIPLDGTLQATAQLTGSSSHPELTGAVDLLGLRLNARQLRDLQMVFRYQNQQMQIEDWRVLD